MSRADRIAALRRLADLLEECPELPCPDDAWISLRNGGDESAVERLQAAEKQLTERGVKVHREAPTNAGRQHSIRFDLDGFTYDAFRIFRDSRATEQEAAA